MLDGPVADEGSTSPTGWDIHTGSKSGEEAEHSRSPSEVGDAAAAVDGSFGGRLAVSECDAEAFVGIRDVDRVAVRGVERWLREQ